MWNYHLNIKFGDIRVLLRGVRIVEKGVLDIGSGVCTSINSMMLRESKKSGKFRIGGGLASSPSPLSGLPVFSDWIITVGIFSFTFFSSFFYSYIFIFTYPLLLEKEAGFLTFITVSFKTWDSLDSDIAPFILFPADNSKSWIMFSTVLNFFIIFSWCVRHCSLSLWQSI